jgi:hypothetical protein
MGMPGSLLGSSDAVSLGNIAGADIGPEATTTLWRPQDATMSLDAQKPKESQVDFRTPIPYFEQDPENHRRNH